MEIEVLFFQISYFQILTEYKFVERSRKECIDALPLCECFANNSTDKFEIF
jgi:hypothetical protein